MVQPVPPHGGKLVKRLATGEKKEQYLEESAELQKIRINSKEYSDLIMLASGAFSPLDGFIDREDYLRVISEMRLVNGLLWPVPVALPVSKKDARSFKEGQRIALVEPHNGETAAILTLHNKYYYDKVKEVESVYGTSDVRHPGVRKILEQGEVYLAGTVEVLSEGDYPVRFAEYATPEETRELFSDKGWSTIAAFQTRNPIHRSHEYLTKTALEICDGLFIHPVVGRLKDDDIPAEVRMECYQALIDNYYPKERVVLKVYPMEMRYAGPREAVLHAIIRQNFGCSHIIIGRDHAGTGNYYGPFDAQKIFHRLKDNDLQIKTLPMDLTFWCSKCSSMASRKTCPHDSAHHLSISGSKLRDMLSRGERPSEEFSRREVLDILVDYYSSLERF